MQLTLSLKLRDDATFTNYHVGDNQVAMQCLRNTNEQFIYLWGEAGVGKSHLLQACCHAVSDSGKAAMYLSLSEYQWITHAIFEDFEKLDLVCIDDIDAIMGQSDWEEALFHFYNRARDSGTQLMVASQAPVKLLNTKLPDLHSRLAWGVSFEIKPLSDQHLINALIMRADNRGIYLSGDVAQFLIRHYPRNMNDLYHILDRLDRASMIEQRRITIPFVKHVLESGIPC